MTESIAGRAAVLIPGHGRRGVPRPGGLAVGATLRHTPKRAAPIVGGMVRHSTRHQYADEYEAPPQTDDRDPAALIPAAVAEVLDIAETWLGWDGRPIRHDGNAWTPNKALRRVTDHLIDHLAEIECRLAGLATLPDRWHGRMVTTDGDFARFTEVELDEAASRLTRLAACYQARLTELPAELVDARPADGIWTLREVVHHVANVGYYAHAVGRLDRPKGPTGS